MIYVFDFTREIILDAVVRAELSNRWSSAASTVGICSVGGAMRQELLSFMFDESRGHDTVIAADSTAYRRKRRACCSAVCVVTDGDVRSPMHASSTQPNITHDSHRPHQHYTPQLRWPPCHLDLDTRHSPLCNF